MPFGSALTEHMMQQIETVQRRLRFSTITVVNDRWLQQVTGVLI